MIEFVFKGFYANQFIFGRWIIHIFFWRIKVLNGVAVKYHLACIYYKFIYGAKLCYWTSLYIVIIKWINHLFTGTSLNLLMPSVSRYFSFIYFHKNYLKISHFSCLNAFILLQYLDIYILINRIRYIYILESSSCLI